MAAKNNQPVRCLIVPSNPGFLVIPSAAVAEIVPLSVDDDLAEGSLLGHISWRGVKVPAYSMEGLIGLDVPTFGKRSKAFIFFPWKGMKKNNFFAIASNHDPRPRLLTDDDIQKVDDEQSKSTFIQASFQYDGEPALIPDLKAIAKQHA